MAATRAGGPLPEGEGTGRKSDLETTKQLLVRLRNGDRRARDLLAGRYLDALRRLAHGRLPPAARSLVDTDDLVQLTVARALDHLDTFEAQREGAYLAYLRRILFNLILDEGRRARRTPGQEPLSDDLANQERSPLEVTIGRERLHAYDEALSRLTEQQREAVVLRVELGFTYEQVAEAIESPSPNAARMLISRALVRLAHEMRAHRDGE
jgi:RNA polymerase sigma-70 factor (ECF subfamily)